MAMNKNYNIEIRLWVIPIFIGSLIGVIFHPLFIVLTLVSIFLLIKIYDRDYARGK